MISYRPLAEVNSCSAILAKDNKIGIWIDEGDSGSILTFREGPVPAPNKPWPEIEKINEITRRSRYVVDLGEAILDFDDLAGYVETSVRKLDPGDLVLDKSGPCITMQKLDQGYRVFWLRFGSYSDDATPGFVDLDKGTVPAKSPVFTRWRLLRKKVNGDMEVIFERRLNTR